MPGSATTAAAWSRTPTPGRLRQLAARLAGRRMEWDSRNGAIVRKGEKHGIPTPLNRMAAALLQAMDADGS